MKSRILCVLLALVTLLTLMAGCGEIAGEIAGNVADTAKKELEAQVKAAFEKYKVDIVELKTTIGKLNGDSEDIQFFCAALVQSDSEKMPTEIAETLGKMFHDAGITVQTGSKVENAYLEHKSLSFKFSDFDGEKTYYVVWCYTDKLPSLSDIMATETTPATE